LILAISRTCVCGGTTEEPNPECERCRLVHTVQATVTMREAQKAYFRGRTGALLETAQAAERYVDKLLRRLNEIQPTLFDCEDAGT